MSSHSTSAGYSFMACLLVAPVDESRGSKSVEVRRVWEVYDECVQFMSRQDAIQLDESLRDGDVSRAWLVWSGAAEAALAEACRFAWSPIPALFLVVAVPCSGLLGLEGIKFGRLVVKLLMLMMLLMCSFTATPLLLPYGCS